MTHPNGLHPAQLPTIPAERIMKGDMIVGVVKVRNQGLYFENFDVEDMSNFAKTMSNFERPFPKFRRALCQRLASARRF
jgi:hypothetical protein